MSGNENIRDYRFKPGTTYGENSQVEINHGINRVKKSENGIKITNTHSQASASRTRKKGDKSIDQTKIKPEVKKEIKTNLKTGIKITSLKRAKSVKETMAEKASFVKKTAYSTWKNPFFGAIVTISFLFCIIITVLILILLLTKTRQPRPKELETSFPDAEALSFEENTLFRVVTFSALSIFVILVGYLLRVHMRLGGETELTASDLAAVRMITMDTREKSMHQSALGKLQLSKALNEFNK